MIKEKIDSNLPKIFITGASGFVGSVLLDNLLLRGFAVTSLMRQLPADSLAGVEMLKGDLSDFSNYFYGDEHDRPVRLSLEGIDVVIHCAARVHMLEDNSIDVKNKFRAINCDATLAMALMAAQNGVQRFVFLSSIKVNGEITQEGGAFSSDDTQIPTDPYGLSKYEAEQGLLAIAKKTGMEVVIIRPALVYGPGVKANFASMIKWANKGIPLPFGAVHNKRTLVALDNLVSFILYCAEYKKTPQAANQVFLISDSESVSTTELLQRVAKAFGKKALLLPVPVSFMRLIAEIFGRKGVADRLFNSLQVDNSKARELLNWKPVVTMDEQLKKVADAYMAKKNI